MTNMIETENLKFEYISHNDTKSLAIDDINISVKKGEFIAVLGHNGSGKSTLAKHMNALLLPTGGSMYVAGIDTHDESRLWDIRQKAGMVFQNPDNQIVATVVEEDVAFGPENLGVQPDFIRKRVDKALECVGMYEYKSHSPHLLSGGQKQRIAIAGIIAMMPECIVLDEPTAMLDPSGRKEVIDTIKTLNREEDITIVLITHFMDEAVQADRVIVMQDGSVMMDGTPKEVFTHVNELKQMGLDVPQVTDLCHSLRKEGIMLPPDILTVEEMVMELCRLK